MATFVYNIARKQLMDGALNLGADDLRMLLLEAAGDENPNDLDIAAVLARALTDELTSTGYARIALANEATVQDDPNNRAEFDADDAVFSGVSQLAAEQVVAAVLFKFITNDAGSIPIAFFDDYPELPLTPNGSDIKITWDAEGIIQL